jgi:hypothetical protein
LREKSIGEAARRNRLQRGQWKSSSMIDRRKFVALLSAVPLIGRGMLAFSVKREGKPPLPPGFVQCDTCAEFNGTTDASNLSWNSSDPPTGEISVSCLCHAILCPRCKKNLIHRPISNTYYLASNRIEHWPYFAGLGGCAECRTTLRRE